MVTARAIDGETYKDADQHGQVHYGDRPPSRAAPEKMKIDKCPTPSPADAARNETAPRLLDANARRIAI